MQLTGKGGGGKAVWKGGDLNGEQISTSERGETNSV